MQQVMTVGPGKHIIYTEKDKPVAEQCDLFDTAKGEWVQQTADLAEMIPHTPFYFSELKGRAGQLPKHYNSWGPVATELLRRGYKQRQEWQRTKTGNRDYLYDKPERA